MLHQQNCPPLFAGVDGKMRAWCCAQACSHPDLRRFLTPRFPRQHHSRDFTPIAARLLSGEDGLIVTLREGRDSWIIGRGFEGTWDVLEATLKEYVIRT